MSRNFVITVKEDADGVPRLLVEPYENIGLAPRQNITIDLPNGTTIQKAQEVARFLNANLAGFRISRF